MPSASADCATSLPMAPRPMTSSVLAKNLAAGELLLAFSAALPTFSSSSALSRTHATPPMMSRLASSMPASTSSFTALALAPGVLKTAMPASANLSRGDVVHASAGAGHGLQVRGHFHLSCMSAERTRMGVGLVDVLGDLIVVGEQGQALQERCCSGSRSCTRKVLSVGIPSIPVLLAR